jgi:regulation of enolase protein 1 (concanavalin A-like superfamily)
MANNFAAVNTGTLVPYPPPKSFTLSTPPKTDIYAAPAHGYVWTAPILYHKIQCSSFKKARVNVSFSWTTIYDQGGLILVFPTKDNPNPDAANASEKHAHPQWVKAGLEINDGKVWASVVARENWADWSLSIPPEGVAVSGDRSEKGQVRATFEFERHSGALYVYVTGPDGKDRSMIREPQWVFLDGRGDGEAWLGVYTCSPDPKGERNGAQLEVTFEDFEIIEQ